MLQISYIINGAKLGGATGAMAPLVFWSRNQSLVVSKWHQLFLPSFGANDHSSCPTLHLKIKVYTLNELVLHCITFS